MRRTLIAVLLLVLVINYVDRASCQTTNTTGTNTTTTNTTNTTNTTTGTNTTNTTNTTTGTNTTGTNTTGGANTNTNTTTQTTTVNNITFFKANGTGLTAVNTYSAQTVSAGKSLYLWLQLTASATPNVTVYVLPSDVGSLYAAGFPLKLSVITQPTAASGTATLATTATYDGNALMGSAAISADSYLMAQIENTGNADIHVVVNFLSASYRLLSPMGTIQRTRQSVASSTFSSTWDIYEMYVPTTNVKVLLRNFNCMGASNMFYASNIGNAQNMASTATLQSSNVVPNNTLEVTYSAVSTVYVVVNPYSGSTQSDGTASVSYSLDASMYNASTIIPSSNYVAGGNGYISYTRTSDQNVQFSWSPVMSASSDYTSPASNPTISYSVFVSTSQDNFTSLMYCGPVGMASANGVSSFAYNTTTTSQVVPLNPSKQYYVGVVGKVAGYAFVAYQNNIPELYVPYQPTSYNYIKPSSSDSNPAGLGVTVFFLVLLIIIVIILAIVLYTKYKAKKNGELGGTTTANRAAATTATAAAATKTSGTKAVSPPQSAMPVLPKKDEPPKKADVKYAPPPPPEPVQAIKVDQLQDDHGLQQVDHHYEVDQQVPDNYDYQAGNEYQGEEYQGGGGNQDDYNPDAYAGQEQGNGEYEVPQDQHEVSPDNDHHHGH